MNPVNYTIISRGEPVNIQEFGNADNARRMQTAVEQALAGTPFFATMYMEIQNGQCLIKKLVLSQGGLRGKEFSLGGTEPDPIMRTICAQAITDIRGSVNVLQKKPALDMSEKTTISDDKVIAMLENFKPSSSKETDLKGLLLAGLRGHTKGKGNEGVDLLVSCGIHTGGKGNSALGIEPDSNSHLTVNIRGIASDSKHSSYSYLKGSSIHIGTKPSTFDKRKLIIVTIRDKFDAINLKE